MTDALKRSPASGTRSAAAPLAGAFQGDWHVLSVRVYYEDTDSMGFVYHANYLKFMERGRTDMLRLAGVERSTAGAASREDACLFVVRHMDVDFLKPARLDDVLCITTRVADVGGASIGLEQTVTAGDETIATARVRAASVDHEGRTRRLPSSVRTRLRAMLNEPSEADLNV